MSDQITSRRRRSSSVAPAVLPDDDDLLEEILLRLPPQPSFLRRASAVCKRWRGLVADPRFLPRFAARHGKPPLLGALVCTNKHIVFTLITDYPPERFDLGDCSDRQHNRILDCRHGRVLVKDLVRKHVIVCESITGKQHRLPIPSEMKISGSHLNGAVLCAAMAHDHVHGTCHSSPYKVALMSMYKYNHRLIACVYSSETGTWGNYVSTWAPRPRRGVFDAHIDATLNGTALYWLSKTDYILEFHLDRQTFAIIEGPPGLTEPRRRRIIMAKDGTVGLFVLSGTSIQMWQMKKVNYEEGATTTSWLLRNTIILDTSPRIKRNKGQLLGYDEDSDALFLHMHGGIYMVQLKSMQCKKLYDARYYSNFRCYPFKSFHAPGIAPGCDGAEVMHGASG